VAEYIGESSREVGESELSLWRLGTLPAVMLMGVTLPCIFLVRVEQYLYYLRPIELLPTYATAWVLLAALSAPIALAGTAALGLTRLRSLRWSRSWVVSLLLWAAAVAALIALLLDGVAWMQTFESVRKAGLGSSMSAALALVAMAAAVPIALTRRGRRALYKVAPTAMLLTVLGGLSTVSIVLFPWDAGVKRASGEVSAPSAQTGAPHIVLLTIDALSAQHMSLYGAQRQTTPLLDAFAKQAGVFERAYANSNFTTSSVSSILTGTRPWTHRAFQIFSWPSVETRRESLPAELERAGYVTGYVATNSYAGASRLGLGPYFGFAASDRVPMDLPCPDRLAAVLPYACPASQLLPLLLAEKLWFKLRASSPAMVSNRHYDPGESVQTALAWLKTVDKSRPVFLWLHLFPPHSPYAAPAPWLGRFDPSAEGRDIDGTDPVDNFAFRELTPQRVHVLDARYDEAVQYVDSYAGAFLTEALATLGDNTAVVIMADHGESFANGYGGHGGPGLYDSVVHVPLIIRLPHQTDALRMTAPVEQIDIAPTLAALAGLTPPASWEGQSLLPLWHEDQTAANVPSRTVFTMNFEENSDSAALTTGALAVVQGSWKLIRYLGPLHYPNMPPLQDELYDLSSDPGETTNRAADSTAVHERLSELAAAELARHGGASGRSTSTAR
jgi:arylsulfatase A-like enzyme